jgi:hypothetical protein
MTPSARRASRHLRAIGVIALLAGLAACSQPAPHQDALQESARYAARARHDYTPPGPPEDPWGPYIREASVRFDIPDAWIRALMRVESDGNEYQNGQPITSDAGAMGLMQVMPDTYDGLRDRYGLGGDPFNPHDNIMAGVAYMREMYDIYGSPAFLAAYNAGPTRLDDYLANLRPLPDETRRYVAMIAPSLQGTAPISRSPAEELAYDALPINIPSGRRYGHPVMLASNRSAGGGKRTRKVRPIEVAPLPEPPKYFLPKDRQAVLIDPPAPPPMHLRGGFRLIATANAADAAPVRHGPVAPGRWAIQVGAYANQIAAHVALVSARNHAHVELAISHPFVSSMKRGRTVLWRARLTGMSRDTAVQACQKITRAHAGCIVLSPEAQG